MAKPTGFLGGSLFGIVAACFFLFSTPSWSATITVTAGENGKVKPKTGVVEVKDGKKKTFTIKPDKGYHVDELWVDGSPVFDGDTIADENLKRRGRTFKYKFTNVQEDHTLVATFEADREFTVTVNIDGSGTVESRPGGLACTAAEGGCETTFMEGKKVKFKAKPADGYEFDGWSDDCAGAGTQSKCKLEMWGSTPEKTVTATFRQVSALRIAEKINVVDPKDQETQLSAPAARNGSGPAASTLAVAPDSDYETDETFVFVEERSVETFDLINEILCSGAQTKYVEMLNQGAYKAMIDLSQCSSDKDDASSGGGTNTSSSATMPDYEQWTVESSRKDSDSPHIVKFWIHEQAGDPHDIDKVIMAKMVITESADDENPYGIFTMNFEGYPVIPEGGGGPTLPLKDERLGGPMFKGYLKSERNGEREVLLKFIAQSTDMSPEKFSQKATLNRVGEGGSGTTSESFDFGQESVAAEYDIAFDADHFLRDDGEEQLCFDRNDFEETAWRYGLYDSDTGDRITLQSGFPIKTEQDGRDYYGWIGYWGLWFPEEVSLAHGDTVYKLGFGRDEDAVAETLFLANGKLKKHTKKVVTLGEIKNVPLDWWDQNGGANYRVVWDGADFLKVAVRNEEEDYIWEDLPEPEAMDLTALPYDTLFFWSQALNGNVRVKPDCTFNGAEPPPSVPEEPSEPTFSCIADNDSPVVLYTESLVYPSDEVPAQLACFMQCPNGADDDSPDLFFDDSSVQYQETPPESAEFYQYSFDSESMLLMYGETPIVQTVENDSYPWGVMSGPLFEPTPENLAKLACEWDPESGSTCGWQAWEKLDEYYTWETGPEQWNRFSALQREDGAFEQFEPPLSVQYVHVQTDPAAPDYKYNGTTFYLEYSGFGELHGLPGKCVNMSTGEDESCGPDTRWIPELTIPDGSEVQGEGATYLVKALEKEQRMRSVDLSECSELEIRSYGLPKLDQWKAPNIGDEPDVEGPPAVIGGVIQVE